MNGLSGFQGYINIEEENVCQLTGQGLPFSRDIDWKGYKIDDRTGDKEEAERVGDTKSIPLWFIISGSKKLIAERPIKANIYKEEDCFTVENEPLDIYAVGFTLNEAIENFMDHVVEFWEHYKALPDNKAGKFAKNLKNKYLTSFIEEN